MVSRSKEATKLIAIDTDFNIKIWNFHSRELLAIIISPEENNSITLWNYKYLIVSYNINSIKVIDLTNNKIISRYDNFKYFGESFIKYVHPSYGNCLIGQGSHTISLVHC